MRSSSSLYSSTMGILPHHYHYHHHHQHQHRLIPAVLTVFAIILCLLVSSTSASSSSSASLPARSLFLPTRHYQLGRGLAMGLTSQEKMKSSKRGNNGEPVKRVMMLNRRRVLIRMGVGSSPPTCRSRCGRCSPCKAVHVAIQPGRSVILEYYPEAWRCKCGNKLFMP